MAGPSLCRYALSARSAPRQRLLAADGPVRRLSRRRWDEQASSTSPRPLDLAGIPVVLNEPEHGFRRTVSTGDTCSPGCWRIPPTPRAGLDFSGPEAPALAASRRAIASEVGSSAPLGWDEPGVLERSGPARRAVGPGPAPGPLPGWPPAQRAAHDSRVPGDPTHPRPRGIVSCRPTARHCKLLGTARPSHAQITPPSPTPKTGTSAPKQQEQNSLSPCGSRRTRINIPDPLGVQIGEVG